LPDKAGTRNEKDVQKNVGRKVLPLCSKIPLKVLN